jgi:predicted ATP-dependent Lon-type protease
MAVQVGDVTKQVGSLAIKDCIQFWLDGKLVGSFTNRDLVPKLKDYQAVIGPFSGGHWIRSNPHKIPVEFINKRQVRFATVDGQVHVFDFETLKIKTTPAEQVVAPNGP